MNSPRTPLLGRLLLHLLVPRGVRIGLMGDLEEAFHRDVAERGLWWARWRYLREASSPSLIRLWRHARALDVVPGAPISSGSGEPLVSSLMRDLVYSIRTLRRAPGFTAVVVLSLALGIGPNTAVFSVVNAVFFSDSGVGQPERLIDIGQLSGSGSHSQTYYWVYERILEGTEDVFEDVAAFTFAVVRIEDDLGNSPVLAEVVTHNYFGVLNVGTVAGRAFLPEEGLTPGTHPVVVISDALWSSRYDRDPDLIGATTRINGRPYTVVGVAAPGFKGKTLPGVYADLWLPIMMYPHLNPDQMSSSGDLRIMGRLSPTVDPGEAIAAVQSIAAVIDRENADSRYTFRLSAFVSADSFLDPGFDGVLKAIAAVLLGGVGVVLLIACVNLAGFFLARASDRRREMAIRISMGANRMSIVRQLIVESLVLAALGGGVGLGLGYIMIRGLLNLRLPIPIPPNLNVSLDGSVLAFTVVIAMASALVFALAPALKASDAPVASTLRDESGSIAGGKGKARSRSMLVGTQMAFSMILLVGAGLFLQSLRAASNVDLGFDAGPAGMITIDARASGYAADAQPELFQRLGRVMNGLPGLLSVGIASRMPLELGVRNASFDVPGVDPPPNADHHRLELAYISLGYLETMGIGLLRGRPFAASDMVKGASAVIVTQALAERFWPSIDPIGKTLQSSSGDKKSWTVVGVSENTKIWSLSEGPRPYLYLPLGAEAAPGTVTIVARGMDPPQVLARNLSQSARAVDRDLFIVETKTMREHMGFIFFLPRMGALLIGGFAGLAVALAAVGLFGMVSYGVSRRTKELGIRISLGADRGRIIRLVMAGALRTVIVGGGLGLLGALVTSRLISRFLIDVGWLDVPTFVVVPLVLGGIAFLAAYLPARKANHVDPIGALRAD